ncbi:cinnamoyl-CoA reductase 1-like [Lolium rigidum]|uniref:cinnamoyl-CoA reductase 1-like n=1 Tax=Lolium rigidum TaxID=89674 RepID=UPI001F5DDBEC|nr:cinnamoyl-CoA reductase 1-like [Lolium rigidum]
MDSPPPPRVCVTGGGSYIASWLVKLLLSRGYAVHATVRDPRDPKNACLAQLDGAPDNLRIFKADMLDYETVVAAFAGCDGVFHVATPVPEQKMVDPEKEMMDPTVKGTSNVLKACSATNIKKLVLVSSAASLCFNPDWPEDKIKDESCWSDKEFCRENENWYSLAKTEAEEMALEYGEKNGLHVATFCPGLVFGPLLQHVALNTSSKVLLYIIKGGPDTMNNNFWPIVDVRDVADALLLLYNKAGPSERYICSLDQMDIIDLLRTLKGMHPNYNYADKMVDVGCKAAMTSDKLKNLGWRPRKLEEMLADSVQSYEKAGLLQVSDGEPCRLPFFYRMPPVQE